MATAAVLGAVREPIVILRSVSGNGQTFALDPSSKARVREVFGSQAHIHPRVSIAHETAADYESMRGDLLPQIIQLLTGVTKAQLEQVGDVVFRDPVTGEDVPQRSE
jgi:hypothetical protein